MQRRYESAHGGWVLAQRALFALCRPHGFVYPECAPAGYGETMAGKARVARSSAMEMAAQGSGCGSEPTGKPWGGGKRGREGDPNPMNIEGDEGEGESSIKIKTTITPDDEDTILEKIKEVFPQSNQQLLLSSPNLSAA